MCHLGYRCGPRLDIGIAVRLAHQNSHPSFPLWPDHPACRVAVTPVSQLSCITRGRDQAQDVRLLAMPNDADASTSAPQTIFATRNAPSLLGLQAVAGGAGRRYHSLSPVQSPRLPRQCGACFPPSGNQPCTSPTLGSYQPSMTVLHVFLLGRAPACPYVHFISH